MKQKEAKGFSINSLLGDTDPSVSVDDIKEQMTKTLTPESEPLSDELLEKDCPPCSAEAKETAETTYDTKALAHLVSLDSNIAYPVLKDSISIGCSATCDITIEQLKEEHVISRTHAKLIHIDGRFFLTDLSSNGTFTGEYKGNALSFTRLSKNVAVEIKNGQIIRFANKLFRFTKEGKM